MFKTRRGSNRRWMTSQGQVTKSRLSVANELYFKCNTSFTSPKSLARRKGLSFKWLKGLPFRRPIQPLDFLTPPRHHSHPLIPVFGAGIGAPDIVSFHVR